MPIMGREPKNVSPTNRASFSKNEYVCPGESSAESQTVAIRKFPPQKRQNATVHKGGYNNEARLLLMMTIVRGLSAGVANTIEASNHSQPNGRPTWTSLILR